MCGLGSVFIFGLVFCMQKTAYEMRISDWSSDVCSSDLRSQRESRFVLEAAWLEPRLESGVIREVEVRREIFFDELTFDTCSRGIPRAYAFDYEKQKAFVEQEQEAWQEGQVWAHRRDAFEAFYVAMLRGALTD